MGRSPHHAQPKSTIMHGGPVAVASPIPAHLQSTPAPTRSSRRRQSNSVSSTAPSSPIAPVTPAVTVSSAPSPASVAGPSRTPNPLSKSYVAPKNHQTRNHGDKDRETCPFPEQYGGSAKCGVSDEDEQDEVLMACCAALAQVGNCAMTPDDLARIIFEDNAWLRAPSAAIERSTPINNAIRTHTKRCEKEGKRNLFGRVQLHGAAHESVLATALLPGAFEGTIRPKGYVYYLAPIGLKKWKNPFEGIDLSFLTAKKPTLPKKKIAKPAPIVKKAEGKASPAPSVAPAPRITLRISTAQGQAQKLEADGDDESEVVAHPPRPRALSRSFSSCSRATVTLPGIRKVSSKPPIRRRDSTMSSGASGSSDSEPELVAPSRLKSRKPPGLSLNTPFSHYTPNSPRHHHAPFLHSPGLVHSPNFGAPQFSPCPSHSLDNTTWTVRRDLDLGAQFETSSSSSDDEMRESEWGMVSGVLVRDGTADDAMVWSAAEDECQIKEATDALRALFPMGSPDEEHKSDPMDERFDHFPVSDNGSVSESISTATAVGKSKKGMKARECAAIPLADWAGNSSPIGSPDLRNAALPIDVSPTQHLSRLRDSFEPSEMDIDCPVWIDESGEGPVRSPDDSFEDHLSSAGETTLEQEKHNDLFAWACEAAASRNQMQVKQEPEDYPSPLTTDDGSGGYRNGSRASSAAFETHSSSSSELDLPELDTENMTRFDLQELLIGPESVTVDELEGWLPVNKEKTPRRKGRKGDIGLSIGSMDTSFSSIGVGSRAMLAFSTGSNRKKPTRGRRQAPLSSPTHATRLQTSADPPHDPPDLDYDMIGTEELELARAEAEAREEASRKMAQQKAERHRACLAACRRSGTSCDTPPTPWLDHPSPFDFSSTWGHNSTDSLNINTPAASMLSPVMLQSVAGLSLGDTADFGVNPKHLVSPTFHPKMFGPPIPPFPAPHCAPQPDFNLEEMVSQAEAAAGLLPPPVTNVEAPASAPIPIPRVNVTPTVPEPQQAEEKPAPPAEPTRLATPPPAEPSVPSTASTSPAPTAKLGTAIGAPKSALANTIYVPGDEGPYHGYVAILKNVCDGVLATVVDNIPVYVHVTGPFKGIGKVDVFRRLDSDFVNATTLLIALGLPMDQHDKHIYPDDKPRYQTVIGTDHSPGVSGVWVSLAQAQGIAQTLTGVNVAEVGDSPVGNILRDDLFHLFATMASLNPKHAPGVQFGLSTFVPLGQQGAKTQAGEKDKIKSKLAANSTNPSKPIPTLSVSSANSKSTPNLSALSTSAPAQEMPRKPIPRGPLVRQTPATPLEAAPQPKRRRATIVEGITPKPAPLSIIKKTGSQSPTTSSPVSAIPPKPPAQAVRKVLPRTGNTVTAVAPAPAAMPKRATRASLGNVPARISTK